VLRAKGCPSISVDTAKLTRCYPPHISSDIRFRASQDCRPGSDRVHTSCGRRKFIQEPSFSPIQTSIDHSHHIPALLPVCQMALCPLTLLFVCVECRRSAAQVMEGQIHRSWVRQDSHMLCNTHNNKLEGRHHSHNLSPALWAVSAHLVV
jgi:hypothetical protein